LTGTSPSARPPLRLPLRAAAIALCTVLAGCESTAPIVIGLAGPFSEPRGQSMRLGAQLAVNQINAAGGVRGRRLELALRDDSAQVSRAIAVATELRDDRRVVAVVGHLTSEAAIAAADIYNGGRDPVVAITPSASNPDLTASGRFTFRVCATDLAHGTTLARFAIERLGARRAAILYLDDDYGRGILGTFADEFRRLDGTIVAADPVLPGIEDIDPYLEFIQSDGRAQVLMVAGDRATARLVLRTARSRGLTLPVIGGDGLAGIETEGALAEGTYLTSSYLADMPGVRNAAFLRAYAATTGGQRPDHRGAGAYDAVYLIADAIRAAGTRRAAIRDGLAQVGRARPAFEGVTGRITFDEHGDVPEKAVIIGVVRGGHVVPAATP
jgi:branched-chain amino acid transport system substrate-binding protein